ncbi:MAG: hypothetical protein ACPL7E_02675, partial [bacterium]
KAYKLCLELEAAKLFLESPGARGEPKHMFPLFNWYLYFNDVPARLVEEAEIYLKKVEEYNPDLHYSWAWDKETDKVYYLINWKEKEEHESWCWEVIRSAEDFGGKVSRGTFFNDVFPGAEPAFANFPYIYVLKGDYAKAIYYLERRERWIFDELPRLTPVQVDKITPNPVLLQLRKKYLSQLRQKGEIDKLVPIIYIKGEPFDSQYCFSWRGDPFISSIPFLEALNISSQW